ncbi:CidA/LrgA family protein [Salipiger pacificus]|uniref:CidA/LrgA family protein n=1 Tax=Alloyangia mangrovi TaxID=1779329 RepID=UPI001CD7762E|nr:CidA/LrgA family protein [Alloyangia mangrovi]MCA0940341.1 CidA/LrgA family protein [Alloyangia pacifica]MCA0945262.1 CidA/LrgA family protein [Alloyangia pacifica]
MPAIVSGIIVLLLFQLCGEVVSRIFALPLPGPVLAMVALVIGMALSERLLALVRPVASFLLQNLSLLFVPVGVGAVARLSDLSAHALAIGVSLIGSTLLAICVGALTFEHVARLTGNIDEEDEA